MGIDGQHGLFGDGSFGKACSSTSHSYSNNVVLSGYCVLNAPKLPFQSWNVVLFSQRDADDLNVRCVKAPVAPYLKQGKIVAATPST